MQNLNGKSIYPWKYFQIFLDKRKFNKEHEASTNQSLRKIVLLNTFLCFLSKKHVDFCILKTETYSRISWAIMIFLE